MLYLLSTSMSMIGKPYWFGIITSPRRGGIFRGIAEGRAWAMDNDSFTSGFYADKFHFALQAHLEFKQTCLFISMPDIVVDCRETLKLWNKWSIQFSDYGYPLAFVCQDGQIPSEIPECSVIFIGGTDRFKLGDSAKECVLEGHKRNIPVHVGRVNSFKRLFKFWEMGCASVDGNYIKYAPDTNFPKLNNWMRFQGNYFRKRKRGPFFEDI